MEEHPEPIEIVYAPEQDSEPDPGEVVWAWVPYEEDASRGKDRPVLILTHAVQRETVGHWALTLTSKDHDRDAEDEARYGRYWMDVGSGDWDSEHRPSEVRLDRMIFVALDSVRREGARLVEGIFDRVIAAAREHHTF